MKKISAIVFVSLLALSGLASAAPPFTTLFLPTLNNNINASPWTDATAYNGLFPSNQTFSGIPFSLQRDSNNNDVFGGSPLSLTIPVNVFGVSDVYTLINSAVGSSGAITGSLTFNGSVDSYVVDLVEGVNVRDHYFGAYVNTTSAPYVTQAVWGINGAGHAHLDMQDFLLPVQFQSQTLNSIVFTSPGFATGTPFLAGATIAVAVPEPETGAMLVAGLGLLAWIAGRKKRNAT